MTGICWNRTRAPGASGLCEAAAASLPEASGSLRAGYPSRWLSVDQCQRRLPQYLLLHALRQGAEEEPALCLQLHAGGAPLITGWAYRRRSSTSWFWTATRQSLGGSGVRSRPSTRLRSASATVSPIRSPIRCRGMEWLCLSFKWNEILERLLRTDLRGLFKQSFYGIGNPIEFPIP